MADRYCGMCHGERGCIGCTKANRTTEYNGLTEFFDPCAISVLEPSNDSEQERSDGVRGGFFFAADLGTTTLAFGAWDALGNPVSSFGMVNPQCEWAADVIGRVDAALLGKADLLRISIKEALLKGFLFVAKDAIFEKDSEVTIAIAGNTVMQHLLMGDSVEGFSGAPFVPFRREGVCIGFATLFEEVIREDALKSGIPKPVFKATVHLMPCFSAFVGGDIFAGAYALGMLPNQSAFSQNTLFADFGTNGELLLRTREGLFAASAAMGCAFEGGRFSYASDLFEKIAKALSTGKMDETGLLLEPYFSEGFEGLTMEDIRSFQEAKGALWAGTNLLCQEAKIAPKDIKVLYLGGSIGRFVPKEVIKQIGLFPKEMNVQAVLVGNACLGGLKKMFRDGDFPVQCSANTVSLAENKEFQEIYLKGMYFEQD